jgi:hypothetical protein
MRELRTPQETSILRALVLRFTFQGLDPDQETAGTQASEGVRKSTTPFVEAAFRRATL